MVAKVLNVAQVSEAFSCWFGLHDWSKPPLLHMRLYDVTAGATKN